MRTDVAFNTSDGVTLRGWHYAPSGVRGAVPVVVMSHGFSAVKEMWLDRFAEAFSEAGLAALVYDHRNLGASDGTPRQEIDPWQQIRDCRDAITFAQTLPGVDPARVGLWGTSYSGAHAIVVAACDRRVKCVVAQVPAVNVRKNFQRSVNPDGQIAVQRGFNADRSARFAGRAPAMFPIVSEDPNAPCVLSTPDAWHWFSETARQRAPNWRNEVTLRSVELAGEYEAEMYLHHVSPTPFLMIVDTADRLCPPDVSLAAYEKALEPKKLVLLHGGHFAAYIEDFDAAAGAARDWFREHL
ncbi:MAG: alpha/beta fold hydrolase [Gammaproteobacteria bacterium]|nr:alpha/beta fold hydrolase [Gammaproteobacteria bacterium]